MYNDVLKDLVQNLAVLMTCHNRVQKTLQCLDVLFSQKTQAKINLNVILVDDGSTDGTAAAVRDKYPQIQVIVGDGNLFWNRGMHRAFEAALRVGFDYYLWLNDDTLLHEGALGVMLNMHRDLVHSDASASIIVASTRDPVSGEFSYGGYGYRRSGFLRPPSLCPIPPSTEALRCDTFCGNCVLIPRQVTDVVGNIDPIFKHRWGDVDYGLRARAYGCKIWIAPGILADCEFNPNSYRWVDPRLPLAQRFKELHSIKGLGKSDWKLYVRRHRGLLWPLIWVRPYLHVLSVGIMHTLRTSFSRFFHHR